MSHSTSGGSLDVPRLSWWLGWRPLIAIGTTFYVGFALGNAVAIPGSFVLRGNGLLTMSLLSATGLLLGVGLWIVGVRTINARVDDVLDVADEELRRAVMQAVGDEMAGSGPTIDIPDSGETAEGPGYASFSHGAGTKPLVRGNTAYTLIGGAFTPERVVIGDLEIDTVAPRIGTPAVHRLALDELSTVAHEDATLHVTLADDTTLTYPVRDPPTAFLDAVDRWTAAEVVR